MLYLYDKAICDDLRRSFNPRNVPDPAVRVIDPEGIIDVAAQLQEDRIKFPVLSVYRNPETPIDTTRTNFTRMHKGVLTVFDNKTNTFYAEKMLPIKLSYQLTALATNTADIDEILRELMFKYVNMYFLVIQLPYEDKRKVRFGMSIDFEGVTRKTSTVDFIKSGKLYEVALPLNVEGAVMVDYTPIKLRRSEPEVTIVNPS